MVQKLGSRLGIWLFDNGYICEKQIDLIRYTFEILCSEFLEFFVILIYGEVTNQWIETLIYIIVFQLLRKCFKGYHAKTILHCILLTLLVYLMSLCLYPFLNNELCALSICISSLLQFDYAYQKREMNGFFLRIVLYVFSILLYLTLSYANMFRLLILIELIVSISLIPERRQS